MRTSNFPDFSFPSNPLGVLQQHTIISELNGILINQNFLPQLFVSLNLRKNRIFGPSHTEKTIFCELLLTVLYMPAD